MRWNCLDADRSLNARFPLLKFSVYCTSTSLAISYEMLIKEPPLDEDNLRWPRKQAHQYSADTGITKDNIAFVLCECRLR
jgi:hypothetical protein